jgi:NAD(P)-dependent dehydrogenase (short-subunit alcohol dehydrogenase family)
MSEIIDPFRLDGKIALITGAGSGLGYATAKCMVAAGAKVVLVGRRKDVLEIAAHEIGESAYPEAFDITQADEVPAFVSRIEKQFGKVDILVNNAGVHCKKPIEETTFEDFYGVINTHVMASFSLARALVPGMKKRGDGSIIFIASMTAFIGMPNVVAYSTAKSGLTGMMRALASELGGAGIRTNAIAPGWIDTPMLHKAIDGDQPRIDKILGRTPTHTFGDPEDIGWAATYLSSRAAKFVNGQVLAVDGGALIGF